MKQAFRSSCAVIAFLFVLGALHCVQAQTPTPTPTPTPNPFVAQITNSTGDSFASDISGNGRFVVIESRANIATENPDNADGNREIFLYDYAQRRIFQITHTKSALLATTACPTPSPTPTPSVSPSPTPVPDCAVAVEVSNNQPVITNDGRYIVFISNAPTPKSFDGATDANRTLLQADGNQEIFIYEIPAYANADLTSGADIPPVDLSNGNIYRVTDTTASRLPFPGTATTSPFVAFDNREVAVNDNGSVIAFTSTRNLTGGNSDGNPDIFAARLAIANGNLTVSYTQVADTSGNFTFSSNPSISGDGSFLAFISNASNSTVTSTNADADSEIFVASFNTTTGAVSGLRQITDTKTTNTSAPVNIFSPGKRMSRNGNFVAFESTAENPKSDGAKINGSAATFVFNRTADTVTKFVERSPVANFEILRLPTFTGDSSTLVFVSDLSFNSDGTLATSSGLNPFNVPQVYSVPVATPNAFTVLTNTPANAGAASIQPFVSNTLRRIAFSTGRTELGGGNPDLSTEVFYLLNPAITSETQASVSALSYFTGASLIPVAGPTPSPTPTPTPTPSPTPTATPTPVPGLAPGELSITTSATATLAPSAVNAGSASETARRPPLPVELNGVSVAIGGAAAGLYYVSPGQINFVVPVGLAASTVPYPIVISNNGAVVRSTLTIVATQPDIFTTTNGPGGRAAVLNVTNPMMQTGEPFNITSTDSTGATVPTVLRIILTGVRGATRTQITVSFIRSDGTTATNVTGDNIIDVRPTDTPGMDQLDVKLPPELAAAGEVSVVVTVNGVGSRPVATAPKIHIN